MCVKRSVNETEGAKLVVCEMGEIEYEKEGGEMIRRREGKRRDKRGRERGKRKGEKRK